MRERFTTASARVAETALARVDAAEQAVMAAQKKQREALVSGERTAQLDAEERMALAQTELAEAKSDAEEKALEASQAALDIVQQKTDNFLDTAEAMGTEFGSLSVDAINNMIQGSDIDLGTALSMQKRAELLKEREETKNEAEQLKLDKEIEALDRAASGAAGEAVAGIATLDNALAAGTIDQDAYDSLSQEMGFAAEELSPLEKRIKELEAEEQTIENQKALQELKEQQALAGEGVDIINTTAQIPDDKTMTAEDIYSTYKLPRLGKQDMKGECGAFVNDVLGMASRYGDTYASKFKNVNNFNPLAPTAGAVFVSTLGNEKNGHTGFVESVNYEDGTVTLVDMNRYGKRKFDRRTVNISDLVTKEGITGYENVANTVKTANPKEGDFTKIVNENIESGMTEEEARKLALEQFSEEQKDMTEAEMKSFTGYASAVEENKIYNEAIENVDMDGFTNSINVLTTTITNPETPITGELINTYFASDDAKRAISAEIRWLLPVLRKESGAAISVGEYKTKGAAFFARKGDTPQVLADKARARQREENVMYETMGAKGKKLTKDSNVTNLIKITEPVELQKLKDRAQGYIEMTDGDGNYLYTKQDIIDTFVSEGIDPYFINAD